MWSSMIWVTSFCNRNNMNTNKRNTVTATIGMCFGVGRDYIVSPSLTISESGENTFGGYKLHKWEATTLENMEIKEKSTRRTYLLYKEDFKVNWYNQKGYSATFENFLDRVKKDYTIPLSEL